MPFLHPFGLMAPSNTYLPAMSIIAWDGLIADIPSGWVLCDGANGTPDLRGRMALGADATRPLGSVGGQLSASLASTTAGSHQPPNLASENADNNSGEGPGGSHAHAVNLSWPLPAHSRVAYIMATGKRAIPAGAVVWRKEGDGAGFTRHVASVDRFLCGQGDDARGQAGSFAPEITGAVASAGIHNHGPGSHQAIFNFSIETIEYRGTASTGGHAHASLSDSISNRPPFVALLLVVASSECPAENGLIVGYNGDPLGLDPGWVWCNGENGTPDLRGRFPRHCNSNMSDLGAVGGDSVKSFNVGLPSTTVNHTHHNYSDKGRSNTQNCVHRTWSWTHAHDLVGDVDVTPPFVAINYIMAR